MQVTDYIDRLVARSLGQSYLVRPRNPCIFEDKIFHAGSADDDFSGTIRSQHASQQDRLGMKNAEYPIQRLESNEDLPDSKTHHSNSRRRSDLSELREEFRHYLSDAALSSAPSKIAISDADNSKSTSFSSNPPNSIYSGQISPEAVSSMPISSKSVSSGSIHSESDSSRQVSPESSSSSHTSLESDSQRPISPESASSRSISPGTIPQSPVDSALDSPEQSDIGLQTKRKNPQTYKLDNELASKNHANRDLDKSRTVFLPDHGRFGKMIDPKNAGKTAARIESNMDLEMAYIKKATSGGYGNMASKELNELLLQSLSVQSQLAEAFRLSMQPANKPRREGEVEKNVQVTIGRVEVRAVPERATPARQKPLANVGSSLEEYLKKPKRGGR